MMRTPLLLFLFLCTFLGTHWLVQLFSLSSYNVAQVEGVFPEQSRLYFRNANGFHPILAETTIGAMANDTTEKQVVTFQLSNRLVNKFHIELVHGDSDIQLHRISLYSFFSNTPAEWLGNSIEEAFDMLNNPNQFSTTFDLREEIKSVNHFFSYGVPFLIASLITTLLANFRWSLFPAIKDTLESNALRGENNISVLDGLRGLAALLVLFHHAGGSFPGSGALGVWLFFVLSGFLLTRGFILQPKKSIQPAALSTFVRRRFNCIVPLYFCFIVVMYLLPGHIETAIRHFLFIQGDGHLWTIIHEMYFYLLLPLIGICIATVGYKHLWVSVAALISCAVIWRIFGTAEIVGIYALGIKARVYFEVFLVGMAGSCWYFGIYKPAQTESSKPGRSEIYAGWAGLGLLVTLLLLSLNLQDFTFHQLSRKYPVVAALLALGILLTALVSADKSIYRRILQSVALRYVGIIGYSFYILHPAILFMLQRAAQQLLNVPPQNINQVWWITVTTLVTLVFASFTYSFIERPFLRKTT